MITLDINDKWREAYDEIFDNMPEEGAARYPICVMSYKDRRPSVLQDLRQFIGSRILVFVNHSQLGMYEYLKEDETHPEVIDVPDEEGSSPGKRSRFIQQYMGENKYWLVHDDIGGIKRKDSNGKNVHHTLSKGIRMIEALEHLIPEYGMMSYTPSNLAHAFKGTRDLRERFAYFCALINGATLYKYDISFSGDIGIREDDEINIQLFEKGIPPVTVCSAYYEFLHAFEGKTSSTDNEGNHRYIMRSYIKFGDHYVIKMNKDRSLYTMLNFNNIKKGKERAWDDDLLKCAKRDDYEAFYAAALKKMKNVSIL